MKQIAPFTSPNAADRELVNHLNELVAACNQQGNLAGDQYIAIKQSGAGTGIGLNIDRINAAIPKLRIKNWYKILTNATGGAYTVRLKLWNASTHALDDAPSTSAEYNVTAYDCLARDYAVADAIVPGWHVYSANADRLVIDIGGMGALFAVEVTNTSGSAGDASTLCTFVYTVNNLGGGVTLGTGKAPKKWRNTNAKRMMTAPIDASIGLAYYDAEGALQLYDANEVPAVTTCA